ncbi:MAG: hypothetical protein ABEJ68_03540 [Halobacteriaceae archaeon]
MSQEDAVAADEAAATEGVEARDAQGAVRRLCESVERGPATRAGVQAIRVGPQFDRASVHRGAVEAFDPERRAVVALGARPKQSVDAPRQ